MSRSMMMDEDADNYDYNNVIDYCDNDDEYKNHYDDKNEENNDENIMIIMMTTIVFNPTSSFRNTFIA